MIPAVDGILETSLYVADLERAAGFYRDVFGFRLMFADERLRAFDVAGRQVLLLFERGASDEPNPAPQGGVIPAHDGGGRIHVAFAISAASLAAWEAHLGRCGVAIESRVPGPRGGTSVYFRDPDGHLVELLTPGVWDLY